MKKTFVRIIGLSAIVMLLLSASKPAQDGRAIVDEEMLSGMYIKAATFLPGEMVKITNLATETSIEDVMVFGTFNGNNGVVAVLSPEVAKQLYITNDYTMVRITKIAANEESMIANRALNSIPETPSGDFDDDSELYAEGQSEIETLKAEPPVQAEELDETPVPPEDENIDNAEVFTPFSNMEVEPVIAPTPEEITAVDTLPVEDPIVEPVLEPTPEKIAIVAPPVEDPIVEPVLESISEEIAIVTPLVEEPIVGSVIAQTLVDTPPVEDPIVKPVLEPTPEKVPNVLIPAQEHPPEVAVEEEFPLDYFIHEEPQVVLLSQEEMMPIETAENDPLAFIPALEVPSISNETDDIEEYIRKYEVDSIQSFGAGNFCIQLATYKNMTNIEKIISEYADNYPVRVVKSEIIPDAYQVVVGPLNKDEYTIVLKRFTSWGFENAFLRPIN